MCGRVSHGSGGQADGMMNVMADQAAHPMLRSRTGSPMRLRRQLVGSLVAGALAAGCTSGNETATSASMTETTVSATAQQTTTTTPSTSSVQTTTTQVVPTTLPATTLPVATVPAQRESSICYDAGNDGVGNFDLVEAYIAPITEGGGYVINAVALGPQWEGRDWGYSFELDGFTYVVVAGVYGDGTLNAFVTGPGTPDDNTIAAADSFVFEGNANVVVPADWLPEIYGTLFDWKVMLLVDGIEVDSCSVTAFGQTGDPP